MKQIAMGYQANQFSGFIFNRHVPDVSPVHYTGRQIDKVFRLDRKEIRRHELTNSSISLSQSTRFSFLNHGPGVDRLSFFLAVEDG